MAHHAYFYAGEREAGITAALGHAKETLGLSLENNPDVVVFRYGLFSVDDARRVIRLAEQSALGEAKLIVIAAERLFHEAQNALLKLFEEPPPATTLVLVVPSAGILLATLRSRMLPLQIAKNAVVHIFVTSSQTERERMVQKILEQAKSDKDEEKQAARGQALRLAEGLQEASYAAWQKKQNKDVQAFMEDLDRFIPILHERSAPLKLIFEHILLTIPKL
ncbi:MAG: polymerase subunit delta, polymerase subunit delta protein [Parcubacteria group bacterium]|nr:polymerase subunit delta, polymerase subunit delta protein [Parcubacteria group bacterium]